MTSNCKDLRIKRFQLCMILSPTLGEYLTMSEDMLHGHNLKEGGCCWHPVGRGQCAPEYPEGRGQLCSKELHWPLCEWCWDRETPVHSMLPSTAILPGCTEAAGSSEPQTTTQVVWPDWASRKCLEGSSSLRGPVPMSCLWAQLDMFLWRARSWPCCTLLLCQGSVVSPENWEGNWACHSHWTGEHRGQGHS